VTAENYFHKPTVPSAGGSSAPGGAGNGPATYDPAVAKGLESVPVQEIQQLSLASTPGQAMGALPPPMKPPAKSTDSDKSKHKHKPKRQKRRKQKKRHDDKCREKCYKKNEKREEHDRDIEMQRRHDAKECDDECDYCEEDKKNTIWLGKKVAQGAHGALGHVQDLASGVM